MDAYFSYRIISVTKQQLTHQLLTKLWKLSEKYSDGNVGGGWNQQNK